MQVFLEATSTHSNQVSIALMSVGLKPKMMAYEEVIKKPPSRVFYHRVLLRILKIIIQTTVDIHIGIGRLPVACIRSLSVQLFSFEAWLFISIT